MCNASESYVYGEDLLNCLQCGRPATVCRANITLCGTCFYKESIRCGESEIDIRRKVWRRLGSAIAAIEKLIDQIGQDIELLARQESNDRGTN